MGLDTPYRSRSPHGHPIAALLGYPLAIIALMALLGQVGADGLIVVVLLGVLSALLGFLSGRLSVLLGPLVVCAGLFVVEIADSAYSEMSGLEYAIFAVIAFAFLATATAIGVGAAAWRSRRHRTI